MQNEDYVSKYVAAITKEARDARNEAVKNVEEYKKNRLALLREKADVNREHEIKRRSAIIHEDAGRSFSQKDTAVRKRIFDKREEIKQKVFAECESKLAEFAGSEEYGSFLIKSAAEIRLHLSGIDKTVKVYVNQRDLKFSDDIANSFGLPCEFFGDDSIKLGGIKAKFANLIIDDTLDSRLERQSEWFEENSGLDIK